MRKANWVCGLKLMVSSGYLFTASALAGADCGTIEVCRDEITKIEEKIRELYPVQETRTSIAGYTFVRDWSRPQLGEAWRDPEGVIWGDAWINPKDPDRLGYMPLFTKPGKEGAFQYCQRIGAQLPKQSDFERLWKFLGGDSTKKGNAYMPLLVLELPFLPHTYDGESECFYKKWAYPYSSLNRNCGGFFWMGDSKWQFDIVVGSVVNRAPYFEDEASVRCVMR